MGFRSFFFDFIADIFASFFFYDFSFIFDFNSVFGVNVVFTVGRDLFRFAIVFIFVFIINLGVGGLPFGADGFVINNDTNVGIAFIVTAGEA